MQRELGVEAPEQYRRPIPIHLIGQPCSTGQEWAVAQSQMNQQDLHHAYQQIGPAWIQVADTNASARSSVLSLMWYYEGVATLFCTRPALKSVMSYQKPCLSCERCITCSQLLLEALNSLGVSSIDQPVKPIYGLASVSPEKYCHSFVTSGKWVRLITDAQASKKAFRR